MQYITKYPKTVTLMDGVTEKIFVHKKTGVEELHIVVKESLEKIQKILAQEGATIVKFEHKQVSQIGNGLSIKLKFQHLNLNNLDELRKVLSKISTINKYTLEEFNTKYSYFKIYYYGDPKKLKSELSKFGYQLENVQGYWELYLNE